MIIIDVVWSTSSYVAIRLNTYITIFLLGLSENLDMNLCVGLHTSDISTIIPFYRNPVIIIIMNYGRPIIL